VRSLGTPSGRRGRPTHLPVLEIALIISDSSALPKQGSGVEEVLRRGLCPVGTQGTAMDKVVARRSLLHYTDRQASLASRHYEAVRAGPVALCQKRSSIPAELKNISISIIIIRHHYY
jgi:hypothetical protein